MHGYVSVVDAEQRRDLSNIDDGLRQVGDKVWSSDRSLLILNSMTGFVKSEGTLRPVPALDKSKCLST
jgi:hypothetical protein